MSDDTDAETAETLRRLGPIKVGEVLHIEGWPGKFVVLRVDPDGGLLVMPWNQDDGQP